MRRSGDRSNLGVVRRRRTWLYAMALGLEGLPALARAASNLNSAESSPVGQGLGASAPGGRAIRVLAPVSLREALDASLQSFARLHSMPPPTVVYGGTPALVRQLQQGLKADLVITADELWMDRLNAEGRLVPNTRKVLVRNRLVLIAPIERMPLMSSTEPSAGLASSRAADPRALDAILRERLAQGRLAVADLQTVPAGRYAREALQWAQWESLARGRLAQTEHVRAALRLVARGEAPLGIVYVTDALTEPRVQVLYRFPSNAHAEIRIPIAQLKPEAGPHKPEAASSRLEAIGNAAGSAQVRSLLEWLSSPAGRAAFLSRGFVDS